jgi:uncharacterized lipoprotein YajG
MRALFLTVSVAFVFMTGCGSMEAIPLDIRAAPLHVSPKADRVRVAVGIFEDSRPDSQVQPDQARIGDRSHLAGGNSYFNIKGGKVGLAVSQVVADFLNQQGVDAWVSRPGDPRSADVRLNGRVLDLNAHAQSHFGWTELVVRSKVAVEAVNVGGQNSIQMTLKGNDQNVQRIFDAEDMEQLLNQAVNDSLQDLLHDTNMANTLTGRRNIHETRLQ